MNATGGFPRMLTLAEAHALIDAQFADRTVGIEPVPLEQALGRVLAHELRAPRDVPGFAHSAMDGYAVRAADLGAGGARLRCVGMSLAGATGTLRIGPGECARVMTGAPIAEGADTVLIQERVEVEGEWVTALDAPVQGTHVRASDDDYGAGDPVVAAGTRLGSAEIGVARAMGAETLQVRRRPRVAVVVTGDELVGSGEALAFGQRYDSNGPMLAALLRECGAEVVACERRGDDAAAIAALLRDLAARADLLLTSGGVSVGVADHLPAIVEREGAIVFWKVRMRPGMPVLLGRIGDTPLFSLPGNPVSVYATFTLLVRRALAALGGNPGLVPRPEYARLAEAVDKRHDRLEFRRARLQCTREGVLQAGMHPSISSGALRGVVEGDCLAELEAVARRFEAGEVVPVFRFPGKLAPP